MGILIWLIVGLIAGLIARAVVPGSDPVRELDAGDPAVKLAAEAIPTA